MINLRDAPVQGAFDRVLEVVPADPHARPEAHLRLRGPRQRDDRHRAHVVDNGDRDEEQLERSGRTRPEQRQHPDRAQHPPAGEVGRGRAAQRAGLAPAPRRGLDQGARPTMIVAAALIAAAGVVLEDGPDGTHWSVNRG